MDRRITTLEELRWYRFEHNFTARWLLAAYRVFKKQGYWRVRGEK